MNQSSASSRPGASLLPDSTGIITTAHLVMIAIVAVIAIAIIVVGARRSAKRRQAEREVLAHQREAGVGKDETREPPSGRATARSQSQTQAAGREPAAAASPRHPAPSAQDTAEATASPAPIYDEPIASAAPLDANPGAIAADAPRGDAGAADGPVTQLKGLGPKVAARLAELGVTTVGDIATLDDAAAARLDEQLGAFSGRMARDRWIEQARFLAAGDRAGFEQVFGRL